MHSENILILTDWSYKDALIQTYTLPYVKIIRKQLSANKKIFLRTLEQTRLKTSTSEKAEINNLLEKENIYWLPFDYNTGIKTFLYAISAFFKLLRICRKEKIGVIHLWCTPPSIMAYSLSLFTNVKIIIDSYEPHAESMVENGNWEKGSLKFRLLFYFEKLISRKAELVISATEGMKQYAKTKYDVSFERFYVKPACVNMELFSLQNRKREELINKYQLQNKIVCVYAGKFGGIYLENEVFDFLKVAADFYGDALRALILTSHSREQIEAYCQKAGINPSIVLSLFVDHKNIPDYMGLGDFALTPVKPVATKRYCTPIKDGEYWALGLPVVITENISDDSEIIEKNNIGAVIRKFDTEEYLDAVKKIDSILKNTKMTELYEKIRIIAITYRGFSIAEGIYSEIYE